MTSRIDLKLHLSQQWREPTLRGDDASCTIDRFHSLQKFCEENRTAFDINKVVSMDPSSAPKTFLDPAVALQIPRMRRRSVSSVPLSASVTENGLWRERRRETLKLLDRRHSRPCWELGPSSGWTPPSCGGPTTRSSASLLVEDVVTDLCRAYSFRLICAWLTSSTGRASGTHVIIEGSGISERRLSSRYRSG